MVEWTEVMSYTASVVVLFCINQPIYCCIYGISNVKSLGIFGDTVMQMPFSMWHEDDLAMCQT